MFCKYCGETIDRKTMKCPACGKSVAPLTGGVGFWDLAAQSAPAAPVAEPAEKREIYGQNGQAGAGHPKSKGPGSRKVSILSIVGMVLLLLLLLMNIKMWADIQELKQNYEKLLSEPSFLEQMLGNIVNKDTEETLPPETTQAPEENPETTVPPTEAEPEWIREQPEERVLTSEEIASKAPIVLFVLKVNEKDLEFRWEKYDQEAGEWAEVDDRHYDEEDKESMVGEQSMLILEKWSEDVYGEYRCVISDRKGNQAVSDSVWLKPAEEK